MTINNWKKKTKYGLLLLILGLVAFNLYNMTGARYYTESEEVKDSARVAKWIDGVDISLDLFKDSYIGQDASLAGADAVKSADGSKVIAPGTTGTYEFSPAIQGSAPEVAYQTNFTASGKYVGDWTADAVIYQPLKFSLVRTVEGENTTLATNVSLEDLIIALNTAGTGTTYEANTLPTSTSYTISWEWPFSVDAATDAKDTALAHQLSSGELSVDISAVMDVRQLD